MSNDKTENTNDVESTCVVCFKTVEIYSIGQCDHPVCYECSTRMRVLCKQNECPICRADLPKVIFTKDIESFTILKSKTERSNLQDVNFGLYFTSPFIQSAYYRLLELNCQICPARERRGSYKNFNQLKDHMRREHELFYCDLCVENLKIFAFERRCYNRQELAQHRRKGDPDNKSHRGHPLCEFCEQRYMDSDELFRHLRKDHFYCHFCDADGKHQYYPSYEHLRNHFLEEHYLCEEGECRNEQFTSAFRSDIDFKAHIASVHSKHLSRAANKQARTLEVEFNFGPRRNEQGGQRNRRQQNSRNQDNSEGATAVSNENYNTEPGGGPSTQVFVNPLRDANFPTLGNETSTVTTSRTSVTFTSKFSPNFSRDEFPTLGGGPAPRNVTITNQKMKKTEAFPSLGAPKNVTITKTSTTKSSGLSSPQKLLNPANFPSLSESKGSSSSTVKVTLNQDRPQSSRSNVSIQFNHKSNGAVTTRISTAPTTTIQVRPKTMDFQDFPALSSSTTSSAPVKQWVQPKPKKQQELKQSKAAPAPVLPPSSLAEFPSLSKKSEKTKKTNVNNSLTMPVTNNWASTETNNEKQTKNVDNNKQKNGDVKKDKGKKKVSDNKVIETKVVEETKSKNKKKKGKNGEASTITLSASNSETEIKKPTEPPTPINEVVKKTSTLKIGNLQPESPKIRPDDFPALGNKPPPGIFVKPPPGFNFLPKNSNNLTFTSSSGQSYPILPTHTYCLPRNFTNRNAKLIENFSDEETMKEFKQYCSLFRSGHYPAEKYYEHCQTVLGSNFSKVFSEMLVLLPDIEKQQELYKVHKIKGSVKDLEECQTCKQIIFKKELKEHLDNHYMENHFPTLGVVEGPNAWKK